MDKNAQQKNPMSKKKIILFAVYGLIAVLLLVTILSINDLDAIWTEIQSANPAYLALAVGCILVFMALYPLSLCILTKSAGTKIKPSLTYSIAMTEHFFNGITPMATGGQPFQAYSFSKEKVKVSESTGLLLANFLVYMFSTNLFALISLFFFDKFLLTSEPWWIAITIIGFTMNFLTFTMTFLLGSSRTVRKWITRFIYFLCRFRLLKKFLEPKAEELNNYFSQVQQAFKTLTRRKGHLLLALLSKILANGALYATNFFILMALGIAITPDNIFFIICGTAFAVTAVVFIPTPGASGGAEKSFMVVFASIIAATGATVATSAASLALLWRLFSYYLVMLISLCFYVGLEIRFAIKQRRLQGSEKQNKEDDGTLADS